MKEKDGGQKNKNRNRIKQAPKGGPFSSCMKEKALKSKSMRSIHSNGPQESL